MKKNTAVEWLFTEIYGENNYINSYTTNGTDAIEALEKAKKIEKIKLFEFYDWIQNNRYIRKNDNFIKHTGEFPNSVILTRDELFIKYINEL
jgi:hypothetical protein